jgi:hypothetical protein
MKDVRRTLSDADISSARVVSRRALLSTLGIGAGIAAAVATGAATHAETKTERRDPCHDADHGPPADGDGCGRPPIS